jgi:hypothetical protein
MNHRATAAISVAPATATDRTAHLVFGLEPRAFRNMIVARGIRHARIGRRLIVRVDDVLEALDALAAQQGTGAPRRDVAVPEEKAGTANANPPWMDDVLARIHASDVLERRAVAWLAGHGSERSEDIVDAELRQRVRQIERRQRRRATIDRERADQGLPPRRWL